MEKEKIINFKYCLVQAFYWLTFCCGIAFMNNFLTSQGIKVAMVGIISATSGILSAVLQPTLGKIADRGKNLNWKNMLILMATGIIISNLLMTFSLSKTAFGVIYGIFYLLVYAMMPLVNGMAFYYENCQISVNFGIARGMGSLMYAIAATIVGEIISYFGSKMVPLLTLISSVLFLSSVILMPYKNGKQPTIHAGNGVKIGITQVFKNYPSFSLMLVGTVLLLSFHNTTTTYMLQIMESVGGGDAQMGIAVSIAATVELFPMFLFSKLKERFSAQKLLLFSALFFFIKAIMLYLATSVATTYASQSLQMLSYGLFTPASVYFAEENMPTSMKMQSQSLLTGAITLGGVLGNLIGGGMVEYLGVNANLFLGIFVTLAASAIIFLSGKVKNRQIS